jgi:hypothetical protein
MSVITAIHDQLHFRRWRRAHIFAGMIETSAHETPGKPGMIDRNQGQMNR